VANLKLVGAVAIKVRPDAKGFRKETQDQIDRELGDVKAKKTVEAKVKGDTSQLEKDVAEAAEAIEKKTLSLKVGIDIESVLKAQRQLEDAISHLTDETIVIDFDDEGSIAAAQARLDEMKQDARLNFEFVPDEKGFKEVLSRIEQLKRDLIIKETIDIDWDEESLDAKAAEIQARLDALQPTAKVELTYVSDRSSLEHVIREVDSALDGFRSVKITADLNPLNLSFLRAQLEAELAGKPITIEYDANQAGLLALKAKLEGLLKIGKLEIETTLDEAALRAQLAKVDAQIAAGGTKREVTIRPAIAPIDYATAALEIAALVKDRTVTIATRLDTRSLLLAAAKLTGLRAAARWTEELARSLGRLDRNLPVVAAVVLTLSTLSSGILSLTANIFSLGNGIGEVVRAAGLLAPALGLGLGAVMTVLTGVFKDFGAAVNGDEKAIEKLTESGKKAAAGIRVSFQSIRETVSSNFWDTAGDAMLRFVDTALPAVEAGLGDLARSLAGIFSGVLDSFSTFTRQGGTQVFFANLTRGFDVAQTGMASFMSGFLTLATVGSTVFPRIGRAFEQWATRFDSWVQKLAIDGTLNRWIDRGIQGMKDLFNAGASLVKVWGNIGQAAQAAGALTLHSFAQMMAGLERTTAGDRFQRNMANIFKGAREASDTFHEALDGLAPAMDVFSITIKNALSNAGAALGAFIATIGDVMSSTRLDVGMTAFLGGLKAMFESLRPAARDVAIILQTFGEVLGTVARDAGPLFRNLFQQLASVLTTAWHALEPFLPGLILLGTTIVNILGPAFESMAGSLIPAFAGGLQDIGNGLVPLIQLMADFAVGVASFVSDMPLQVLAGFAAAILAVGTSMRIAATIVPLAAAAMEAFGAAASIAAIRVQLMIPVVGLFLAALTGGIAAAVTGLATSQRDATPFAAQYAAALEEDARAANNYSDAIGEATLKTAAKNLVDSGAFQLAEKLGISHTTLTKAVTGNADAYDEVMGKINNANKTYDDAFSKAQKAARGNKELGGVIETELTPAMGEANKAADELNGKIGEQKGSFDKAREGIRLTNDVLAELGVNTEKAGTGQQALADQAEKTSRALGQAAAASATLTDTFSSNTAKVDAMRKTLELLVGKNTALAAAENLGAYAKGFQDLLDTVTPLKGAMEQLGAAAYGENGFLNVASGNKAVLQINQALVEQVNNTWLGAKAVYDQAIAAGKTAQVAFQESKAFIDQRKGDYDQLAKESGVAADKVQGQWEAAFGKEWVLKVTLSGATEAAAIAQQMVTALKGNFDGQKFTAMLDADPELALLAIKDPVAAAEYFVNTEWKAQLTAAGDQASETIRKLTGQTEADWVKGNFMATLKVAKGVPGLAEALQDIRNGVGVPFYANIFAQLNGASQRAVEIALLSLTRPRTVAINVAYSATGDVPVARGGQRVFAANGGVFNGRGIKMFANGGIENHVAQITRPGGPIRIWSEPETQGEAYLPLGASKRPRSVQILKEVASRFGYQVTKAQQFANGGTTVGPTSHTSADVHIGSIHTVDMNEAVAKIRQSQRDALAVAGISSIGV
jgi:hypothetical protein